MVGNRNPREISLLNLLQRINTARVISNYHLKLPPLDISHEQLKSLPLYVEIFLKCTSDDVIIERWTITESRSLYSPSNPSPEDKMLAFLENYLRNGEVSQFIDGNSLFDEQIYFLCSPLPSSSFISSPKCLDLPIFSTSESSISIRVEWLPIHSHLVKSSPFVRLTSSKTSHLDKFKSIPGPRRLVGSFLENLLLGMPPPCGCLDSFSLQLCCVGENYTPVVTVPLAAFFFDSFVDSPNLCPYLGCADLRNLNYRIINSGILQLVLFNPNGMVVRLFLINYDLSGMPPNSSTFIRQKITYAPIESGKTDVSQYPNYLQYCVHIRVASSSENEKILGNEIRIIFPSHPLELESDEVDYGLVINTQIPLNPNYSLTFS